MQRVSLYNTTIPYTVIGRHGGAVVLLKPAAPGTGVIAGGGVRAVLEAVGVRDILSKSQGSPNLLNVTMATLDALSQLRNPDEIAATRGKEAKSLLPFWDRKKQEGTNNG
jgi:small subunit ribosomal protein S5